jgi:magnesium-transporting ATPase (P-type)
MNKTIEINNLKTKLKKAKEEIKKEKDELKKETLNRFTALITAAFGLVAALAWNDTIKALFVMLFGKAETFWAMLVYAIIVTLIAVYITYKLSKMSSKLNR